MGLKMLRAVEGDAPGLAAILFEHFTEGHEWEKVQFSEMKPRDKYDYFEACLHEDLTQPELPCVIVKMVDEETGEIVAFHHLVEFNVPALVRENFTPIIKPKGYNVPPIREYYGKMKEAQAKNMGDAPFLHVADLSTKVAYRRRGISKQLVRWGMDYAATKGLPIYVEATPDGEPVYAKMGWEVLSRLSIDLGKYGGNGSFTEAGMVWRGPR